MENRGLIGKGAAGGALVAAGLLCLGVSPAAGVEPVPLALPEACQTMICVLDGQAALHDRKSGRIIYRTAEHRGERVVEHLTTQLVGGKPTSDLLGDPRTRAGAARRRKVAARLENDYNEFAPVIALPRRAWPAEAAAVLLDDLATRIDWKDGRLELSGPGLRQPLSVASGLAGAKSRPEAIYAAPASNTLLVTTRTVIKEAARGQPAHASVSGMLVALPLDRQVLFQRALRRLPQDAAAVVSATHAAAGGADWKRLRKLMKEDFQFSFGGDKLADQALEVWRQEKDALPELVRVLEQGCALDKASGTLACDGDGGASRRAGFALTPLGWRFTYFLAGD